jgi:hypothetical protein
MATTIKTNELPLVNDLTGARVIGLDGGGNDAQFPLDKLVRSVMGVAIPSTVPTGTRFTGETWLVDSSSYGNNFTGFGNQNVPVKVGEKSVTNARFVWNAGSWVLQRDLLDISGLVTKENFSGQVLNVLTEKKVNLISGTTWTDDYFLDNTITPVANNTLSYSDFLPVEGGRKYKISVASRYVGHYFNSNKAFLGFITTSQGNLLSDYQFIMPSDASFMKVNKYDSDLNPFFGIAMDVVFDDLVNKAIDSSVWKGKIVAWYGTSIPAGYPNDAFGRDVFSYANKAVHALGATIINKCVSGGYIKEGIADARLFVNTSSAINYQNSLIALIGTTSEPDLVVFDYGVNDFRTSGADINNFDIKEPYTTDPSKTRIDTRVKTTFIGAHNFIIDAMLLAKPTMKFAFVTHFSLDSAQSIHAPSQTNYYLKMIQAQQAIAEYWSAPVLNMHEKTGFRIRNGNDNITKYMPDTIHPASGDGRAVNTLTYITREFLKSIA